MARRDLTDAEREEFIKDNFHGTLSFSGDKSYAIPLAYFYRKGTLIIGLTKPGRKIDYLEKSPNVSFTICKPRWYTPNLKEPCTSVIVEGKLEEVTDRAYYGLDELKASERVILLKINADNVGARICINEPCELLTQPWVSAEAYARRLHEPEKASK